MGRKQGVYNQGAIFMVNEDSILTSEDKNFLMSTIKTDKIFNRKILSIRKVFDFEFAEFFLVIKYEGGKSLSSLGFVELFKGLELGKDYTLKELGL